MDQTLKLRRGSASIELILIAPLFVSILAFGGIFGSYSRLISFGSSVGDDMLRFADNQAWEGLVNSRVAEGSLEASQIKWLWQMQHPESDLSIHVVDLVSETDGMSVGQATDQQGEYTADHIGLEEEITRLLNASTTININNLGEIVTTTNGSPAISWFENHGNVFELFGLNDLLEGRSIHRSIRMELQTDLWIAKTLALEDIGASFNVETHRRQRNKTQEDWRFFQEASSFHQSLNDFLIGQGEENANLEFTPFWDLHKNFQTPN